MLKHLYGKSLKYLTSYFISPYHIMSNSANIHTIQILNNCIFSSVLQFIKIPFYFHFLTTDLLQSSLNECFLSHFKCYLPLHLVYTLQNLIIYPQLPPACSNLMLYFITIDTTAWVWILFFFLFSLIWSYSIHRDPL